MCDGQWCHECVTVQHDESDGTLKMWDMQNGSQVREPSTGIVGVWQFVCDGRWCVVVSNCMDSTIPDVCDSGGDKDEDQEGELVMMMMR